MMVRAVVMQRCGVRGRDKDDQQAQSQEATHCVFSIKPSRSYVMRAYVMRGCRGFTIDHIGGIIDLMPAVARPQKLTFAEMRAAGVAGLPIHWPRPSTPRRPNLASRLASKRFWSGPRHRFW